MHRPTKWKFVTSSRPPGFSPHSGSSGLVSQGEGDVQTLAAVL